MVRERIVYRNENPYGNFQLEFRQAPRGKTSGYPGLLCALDSRKFGRSVACNAKID